jgi:hypothetical protein
MRSAITTLFFLSMFAFSSSPLAEDSQELDSLRNAKVIFCTFDRSTRTDFVRGRLVPRESKDKHEMVFDSLDFFGGKARLVATGASIDAFLTSGGATFFEGQGFDNHSFTTVFPAASANSGELVAVHSVHALTPGIKLKSGEHFYVPEQRYGSCKVRT